METSKLEEALIYFISRAGAYPFVGTIGTIKSLNHFICFLEKLRNENIQNINIPDNHNELTGLLENTILSLHDKRIIEILNVNRILSYRDFDARQFSFDEIKKIETIVQSMTNSDYRNYQYGVWGKRDN